MNKDKEKHQKFLDSLFRINKINKKDPDFDNGVSSRWQLKEFNSYIKKRGLKGKYGVFFVLEKDQPLFVILDNQGIVYKSSNKEHIGAYLDVLSKIN